MPIWLAQSTLTTHADHPTPPLPSNWYGKDIIENAAAYVVLEHNVGFSETNNMSNMGFLGSSVSRKYLDNCR